MSAVPLPPGPASGTAAGAAADAAPPRLARRLGLLGLAATGICSMLGAGINIVPFALQRSIPGIDGAVLPAFLLAAVPAVFAALAYAMLASAMPRAGGSYVFASRGLHPYLGFVASFSQWFGLSIAIGVVSYVIPAFLRDVAEPLGLTTVAAVLDGPVGRPVTALAILWAFVLVNLRGLELYERTLVPLMLAMFALGGIVIVAGFAHDHTDFTAALLARTGSAPPPAPDAPVPFGTILAASSVLFASFIGFDSIAQAGGEAKHPGRTLPLAIALAIGITGTYYVLFTAATYHAVPWSHVKAEAMVRDVTAPGLLGTVLSPGWTVAIVAGAAIALINDLPAMLLAVSRLMFAWAADGVFPRAVARVHPVRRTPQTAILVSALVASGSIVGSHLAGDFFLGVDILVTAMLCNFLVMCLTVLAIPRRNAALARAITVLPARGAQVVTASLGTLLLGVLFVVHVAKDLRADVAAWYFRSTPVWLLVMLAGTLVYWRERRALARCGADVEAIFATLPPE